MGGNFSISSFNNSSARDIEQFYEFLTCVGFYLDNHDLRKCMSNKSSDKISQSCGSKKFRILQDILQRTMKIKIRRANIEGHVCNNSEIRYQQSVRSGQGF